MVGPAIVELARSAVRRLASAAPGDDARQALARIERVGMGPPYTVAIAGDLAARTELLNGLAGERLFDPARRDPGRIVLSLRRGAATSLRARRRDGSVEDRRLGAEPEDAIAPEPVSPGAPRRFERGPRSAGEPAGRAQTVPADDAPAFRDAIVLSAEAETTALVRRPPWWAVWSWLVAWWRTWRPRRSQPSAPPPAAPVAPAPAHRALANTVARAPRTADPRQQFVDALSACLADDTVERLFVEVGGGPCPTTSSCSSCRRTPARCRSMRWSPTPAWSRAASAAWR